MNNWKEEKKWSDKFLPEIKRKLGEFLFKEPPIAEDMEHNTDLTVLTFGERGIMRVGCRIRRYAYYERYHNQFTIREGQLKNKKSELTKIVEGWGDYLFYGFSNSEESSLIHSKIIDLNKFRLYYSRMLITAQSNYLPGEKHKNEDGSSLVAFRDSKELLLPGYKHK